MAMTQGRTATIILVLLDVLAVILAFNFVARAWGVLHWRGFILAPLTLPVLMHFLAVYLIDGYNPRTDMMSVTYTSLHSIALMFVLLFTLLLTYAFIPAGYPLQVSRLVITGSCVLLVPITLSYRRCILPPHEAAKKQRVFHVFPRPGKCDALSG